MGLILLISTDVLSGHNIIPTKVDDLDIILCEMKIGICVRYRGPAHTLWFPMSFMCFISNDFSNIFWSIGKSFKWSNNFVSWIGLLQLILVV